MVIASVYAGTRQYLWQWRATITMSTQTSSGSRCKCVITHLISIALLTLSPDPFSWTQDGTAGQNSGTGGFVVQILGGWIRLLNWFRAIRGIVLFGTISHFSTFLCCLRCCWVWELWSPGARGLLIWPGVQGFRVKGLGLPEPCRP